MLRANAHHFVNGGHLRLEIKTCYRSSTTRLLEEAAQHRDGCGLTRTVVSKEAETLASIHTKGQILNGDLFFLQILTFRPALLALESALFNFEYLSEVLHLDDQFWLAFFTTIITPRNTLLLLFDILREIFTAFFELNRCLLLAVPL